MLKNLTKPNRNGLKTGIIRFVVYGGVIYLTAEFLKWNAQHQMGESKFAEDSLVESVQSILLLTCSFIYLAAAFKYKSILPLASVLFAFTFASLIREQDAFLDEHLYDGAWQTGAFSLLILAAFLIYRKKDQFLSNMNDFVPKFSFGILLSGIFTTYIFARLYGRKVFWMAVMNAQYTRDVKTISEESLELFGYAMILIASAEFYWFAKAQDIIAARTSEESRNQLNVNLKVVS